MFKKVEGEPNLVKNDMGVVLNINMNEGEVARERKRQRKLKENEMEELKNDVRELKEMVLKLIEKQ